jgi:hypothetical protein
MSTRSSTSTKNAVYYVENETMRGLISIISQTGLSLEKLLGMKDMLVSALVFFLERRTLNVLQLEFLDRYGNILTNGFGVWKFRVEYGSSGSGVIAFPVNKVLAELRNNPLALREAVQYNFTFMIPPKAELPDGWSWGNGNQYRAQASTYVASFGYDPLNVSISRE